MKLEILIAIAENLKTVLIFAAGIGAMATLFFTIGMFESASRVQRWPSDDKEKFQFKWYKKGLKWFLPITIVSTPFCCIPSINDVWKVRIALIKLQLASPENLEKGSEVIERLGKKLECKYLGCDEEKKK